MQRSVAAGTPRPRGGWFAGGQSVKDRSQGNYHLAVRHFGPIVKAEVDLRPLTVFVGPSNTGKSYLAILIYALHRCFENDAGKGLSVGAPGWNLIGPALDTKHSSGQWKDLDTWASRYTPGEPLGRLPPSMTESIRSVLERPEGLDDAIESEISRCFGLEDIREMRRRPASRATTVKMRIPRPIEHGEAGYELLLNSDGLDLRGTFGEIELPDRLDETSDYPSLFQLGRMSESAPDRSQDRYRQLILARLAEHVHRSLLKPLCASAHYLPADRTGVMHAHQVVVGTLVQSATTAGLRPSTHVPRLSGVLADFLNQLIAVGSDDRRRRKPAVAVARALEKNLLSGTVRVDRSVTVYPAFFYRPEGWPNDLPMMRASAMVSELAPVVLYLRHVVNPGDVLIIEEPEAHLHPAKQVELTHHLAAAVHAGIRVVVTTHSEWVLEALANLVRLSGLPPSKREGIHGAEHALSTTQVGAWMFTPKTRPKGSVVEEIPLDVDAGTFPAGYGEITESLYNEWASITNRIETGRHQ